MRTVLLLLVCCIVQANGHAQNAPQLQDYHSLLDATSTPDWSRFREPLRMDAATFFSIYGQALGIAPTDRMVFLTETRDDLGYVHQKFQQHHRDLVVEGAESIVHIADGAIVSMNGHLVPSLDIEPVPVIAESTALEIALRHVPAKSYGWEVQKGESRKLYGPYPEAHLVVTSKKLDGHRAAANYALAYKFLITTVEPAFSRMMVYVDAITGEVLRIQSMLHADGCNCCTGSVNHLYHGVRNITTKEQLFNYELNDQCRGGGIQPFINGNNVTDQNNNWINNPEENAAASAHWSMEMTYDYFLSQLGRNSFDNGGASIVLNTDLGGLDANNAFYDPVTNELSFGHGGGSASDDLVSLDVVGHEFTHGVTEHTANLTYAYESGALNESFSDILGTMVEYYGLSGAGDYLIGEDFWVPDGKLRDMQDPNSKNHPDTYGGAYWHIGPGDNGGVHTNSGVQNFWFYLLSEGGSGVNDNSAAYNVSAIGRNSAAAIAYRNLTTYLTSGSDYSDAKNGAIWSARDLFGWCSNEVVQTIKAWDAVGVSSIGGIGYNLTADCGAITSARINGQAIAASAINELQANCNIPGATGSLVELRAGHLVRLLPGFRGTAHVHVYIDPCLNDILLRGAEVGSAAPVESLEPIRQASENNQGRDGLHHSGSVWSIYPNPASDQLFVRSYKTLEYAEILLIDATGRTVRRFVQTLGKGDAELAVADLETGTYVCVVLSAGVRVHTERVVVQH